MDTKNLSPAFFTSLAVILIGALLLGLGSSFVALLGWLLLFLGLILNVFSTLVVIQKAKGGPLPELIARADSSTSSDAAHGGTSEPEYEEHANPQDPAEPDTETQNIVFTEPVKDTEENERIFQSKYASGRNR